MKHASSEVSLVRALSKLGVASRTVAEQRIVAGDVSVDGVVVRNPKKRVLLGTARISVAGKPVVKAAWRFVIFHKPRDVTTTRRDELGRRTIYDLLPADMQDLVTVGRLDQATSGLLFLTSDTKLADWLCDPTSLVARVYLVSVKGMFSEAAREKLLAGFEDAGEHLQAQEVTIRKQSRKESHLTITLCQGKNREVRRLCAAVGCAVTRLKRVSYGPLALQTLASAAVREIDAAAVRAAFPSAPIANAATSQITR